jgi:hypothetical protein
MIFPIHIVASGTVTASLSGPCCIDTEFGLPAPT